MAPDLNRPPISVTYSTTPTLLRHLPFILNSLNTQFPLRNLHWKTSSRPSIRTIQECDVRFIGLMDAQSKGDVSKWSAPSEVEYGSLLSQSPLIHIAFVECEDSENYKSFIRPHLNTWLSSLPAIPHSQKIIVLVNVPPAGVHKSSESKGGVFSNIRAGNQNSTVFNKMKTDFETGTKEQVALNISTRTRCISLSLPSTANQTNVPAALPDPTLFVDLLQALKELTLSALDSIITEREQIVRQSESYMHSPPNGESWNFSRYFLLKECLACSFENMGLSEDALKVYDELEASLALVMRENLAWIGRPGTDLLESNEQLICSQPDWRIISRERQQERQRIFAGTFSIFEFRCFLFRRQSEMIRIQHTVKPIALAQDLIRRAVGFISTMGRWLRSQKTADPSLIEAWIYDASCAVDDASIEMTTRGAQSQKEEQADSFTVLNRARTELLNLAVLQLDRTGVTRGFLPSAPPFVMSSKLMPQQDSVLFDRPDASPAMNDVVDPKTNKALPTSEHSLRPLTIASRDNKVFQSLYDSAIDRARQAEIGSGRVRGTQALDEKVAANAYHQSNWQVAYDKYLDLSQQYKADEARMSGSSHTKWPSLRLFALSRALECHLNMELPVNRTFTLLGLEYLKIYTDTVADNQNFERPKYEESTITKIVQSWNNFNRHSGVSEMEILEHPILQIVLGDNQARSIEDEDGACCNLQIRNMLPVEIHISNISICFSGTLVEQLWFTAGATILKPGINYVDVTCLVSSLSLSPMPVAGLLCMDLAKLSLDNLCFEYSWTNPSDREARLLFVPRNPTSMQACARVARDISLAAEPYFEVSIRSGRNEIHNAVLVLSSSRKDVRFRTHATKNKSTSLDMIATRQDVQIPNMARGTELNLLVPYACPVRLDVLDVRISLDYETEDRRDLRRALREFQLLDLALPIAVNVQDFFRSNCLISKFTVSSATRKFVRIVSAELSDADTDYKIQSFNPDNQAAYITADKPVAYLFKMEKENRSTSDSAGNSAVPKLVLTYSIINEELEDIIGNILQEKSRYADDPLLAQQLVGHIMNSCLKNEIVARYVDNGDLRIEVPKSSLSKGVEEEIGTLQAFIQATKWTDLQKSRQRTLTVPVEIPPMQIIVSSCVTFPSSHSQFSVGRPIRAQISMTSSHSWADTPIANDLQMIYDIIVDRDNWLVSGNKRGTFQIGSSQSPHVIEVTLIPLRHGLLPYPSIITQPLPPTVPTSAETQEQIQANAPVSYENHQIDVASRIMIYPAPAQHMLMQVVREVSDSTESGGTVVA